ncbi:unnamed protein product [Orchesella dallaii]|uniref:E3 SUMO-protein ligase NSE2 n=1 Tax=Orchesella dallaii TaxID=48710 RepID=A0ABP1QRX9_9HEXA
MRNAEKAMDQEQEESDVEKDEDSEITDNDSNTTFLSHVPYTLKDLFTHQYKPFDEDKDVDMSVLPTVDPITKELIFTPLRNKFCNHVFDENSIYDFISANPDATCPMHACLNKRILDPSHLVSDPILTAHVRQKNFNSSV